MDRDGRVACLTRSAGSWRSHVRHHLRGRSAISCIQRNHLEINLDTAQVLTDKPMESLEMVYLQPAFKETAVEVVRLLSDRFGLFNNFRWYGLTHGPTMLGMVLQSDSLREWLREDL